MKFKPLPHNHNEADNAGSLRELSSDPEYFKNAADMFKQLSDTTRVRIFWLLCHCEECVINISAMLNMSSPAVSHHLRQLKAASLVTSRREGKEVYYRASDNEQSRLLHKIIEQVIEIACPKP